MASLFGALDTAVTGLTAQSAAFSNISDNIANSQTDGFKGTETTFADYLSTSTATTNDSASSNPLALAISGQGFFQVSQETGSGSGTTISSAAEYSRDGNITVNSAGYLVNDSSQVIDGWLANPTTGVLNETQQVPIQISQSGTPPVATANVNISANLPATPASSPTTAQVDVYDSNGTQHAITLSYTQTSTNNWTVAATDSAGTSVGSGTLVFNANGTISNAGSAISPTEAGFVITPTFPGEAAPQSININLGTVNATTGVTQDAGTTYTANSLTQDGLPPGAYSGVATQSNGNVVVSYTNGYSQVVAKIPVVQFADADALQRQNGQGFTATAESGTATPQDVANSGSATLVTGSVEGSNVDIATEFTHLIVAQQAYAANAKVVTTANDMLTTTIDMIR
jgi:flagellar hook protein FlgE